MLRLPLDCCYLPVTGLPGRPLGHGVGHLTLAGPGVAASCAAQTALIASDSLRGRCDLDLTWVLIHHPLPWKT